MEKITQKEKIASLIQFNCSFFFSFCRLLAEIITTLNETGGSPFSTWKLVELCFWRIGALAKLNCDTNGILLYLNEKWKQADQLKSHQRVKTIKNCRRGFRITSSSTVKLLDAKKRCSSSLISGLRDTGRTQVLLFQLTLMGVRFHPSVSQTDRWKRPAVKALTGTLSLLLPLSLSILSPLCFPT